MDRLLAMALQDGQELTAIFETDAWRGSDLELAAGDEGTIARARVSLERALDDVRPVLERVATFVSQLSPSEAEVEFGLKIGGETGIIVAKGTTEVNFVVRLTWKRGRRDAGDAS